MSNANNNPNTLNHAADTLSDEGLTAAEAARYPAQPIWPGLVAALHAAAERVERRHFAGVGCKAEIVTLPVAAALRQLERDGYCLNPTDPKERHRLCAEGAWRVRKQVWTHALHALRLRAGETGALNRHRETASADLVSEAWHPRTYLYGTRQENAYFPASDADPLCGATGATLANLLIEEFGVTKARAWAWAWVLLQIKPKLEPKEQGENGAKPAERPDDTATLTYDEISGLLGTLGHPVSPALLRKWKGRELLVLDAQKDAIRARLAVCLADAEYNCHKIESLTPSKFRE